MRISDWSSDVCSSDLIFAARVDRQGDGQRTVVNGAGDQRGVAHQRAEPDVAGADDGVARQPDRIGPAAERVAAAVVADLPLDLAPGTGFGGAAFGSFDARKRVVSGQMWSVRFDIGGARTINKTH